MKHECEFTRNVDRLKEVTLLSKKLSRKIVNKAFDSNSYGDDTQDEMCKYGESQFLKGAEFGIRTVRMRYVAFALIVQLIVTFIFRSCV